MARMFDTEFDYGQETYTATVVISGDQDDKTVAVKVPEALRSVVPEEKIVVEHYNTSKKTRIGTAKDPALVESILEAVEKHEESEPPLGDRSLWS